MPNKIGVTLLDTKFGEAGGGNSKTGKIQTFLCQVVHSQVGRFALLIITVFQKSDVAVLGPGLE